MPTPLRPDSLRELSTNARGADDAAARDSTQVNGFPTVPPGWYYVSPGNALRREPLGYELGHRRYVAFRDAAGRAVVLDARCSHMSADLARGAVKDGILHCPLHDWQYAGDGRCVRIPACTQ